MISGTKLSAFALYFEEILSTLDKYKRTIAEKQINDNLFDIAVLNMFKVYDKSTQTKSMMLLWCPYW